MTIKTQIAELANTIALQAEAIAAGTTSAGPHAVAQLMANNVETLLAWTAQEQEAASRRAADLWTRTAGR